MTFRPRSKGYKAISHLETWGNSAQDRVVSVYKALRLGPAWPGPEGPVWLPDLVSKEQKCMK